MLRGHVCFDSGSPAVRLAKAHSKLLVIAIAFVFGLILLILPPEIALFLCAGLLFCLVIWMNPYIGIVTFLFLVYIRPQDVIPGLGALHLNKIIALGTLFAWFTPKLFHRERRFVVSPLGLVLFAFLLVMVFSFPNAFVKKTALDHILAFAKNILIFICIINIVNTFSKWRYLLWTVVAFHDWLAIEAVRHFYSHGGVERTSTFTGGFFEDGNDFALALLVVIPYSFALFKTEKKLLLRLVAGCSLVIFVLGTIVTGSRGGFLGLAVVLGMIFLTSRKKLVTLLIVGSLLAGSWYVMPMSFKERMMTIIHYEQDTSAMGRIWAWSAAVAMAKDRPLFGVGPGNFHSAYGRAYRPSAAPSSWRAAHSLYFQILGELGFLGSLCFCLLLFFTFRENYLNRRFLRTNGLRDSPAYEFSQALDLGLIGYLSAGAFLSVAYYPHLYIIIPLAVALRSISMTTAVNNPEFSGVRSGVSISPAVTTRDSGVRHPGDQRGRYQEKGE